MKEALQRCIIVHCPEPATHSEEGEVGRWLFRVHYCPEHFREIDKGTPVGGLGIDATRIEVEPKETALPKPPVLPRLGPQ